MRALAQVRTFHQTAPVVSRRAPRSFQRAPRSAFQRAVLPVLGGLLFFVLLGLATWGIAAILSRNPERVNEDLAATTFRVGEIETVADIVAEDGPLIFPDLVRSGGNRTVVLDHTGTDPRRNWRAYYAFPADRTVECKVEQVRGTRTFTDCEGRTLDVEDLAPPPGVRVLVSDSVTIDLTGAAAAAEITGTTDATETTGAAETTGTAGAPATSDTP